MAKSSLGCLCGSVPAREESAEEKARMGFGFVLQLFLAVEQLALHAVKCVCFPAFLHKIFLEANIQLLFLLRGSGACLWPFFFIMNLEF